MERESIDAVVRQLRPGPSGWRCKLPNPVRFFDQPVELLVDTSVVRDDEPPPVLAPAKVELVRLILGRLLCILSECERQYRRYINDLRRPLGKVHVPEIWVSREWLGASRRFGPTDECTMADRSVADSDEPAAAVGTPTGKGWRR